MDSEERVARAAAKRRKAEGLARRLRRLRERRGLTPAELERRAGVPRQLVWGLEQATRTRPAPATLEKLAAALGVTAEQLRGHEPIPELEAEPGLDDPADPAGPPPPEYLTALGMLPVLPPGTELTYKREADGALTVTLRIPGPCNRAATGG